MKRLHGQWLVYILIAGITGILVQLHPTQATSVDSRYYLQSAESLLAGRGYAIREDDRWVWNSTFPMGYSVLIALVSVLTNASFLWASKLVNLLALALFVRSLTNRLGSVRASWLISVWALGSFLKIIAYTWSETVFLVLLTEWVWQWHGFRQQPNPGRGCRLLGLGVALSLTRYVGGFVFVLPLLTALIGPKQSSSAGSKPGLEKWTGLFIALAGMGLFAGYAYLNYRLSGYCFGGKRLLPTEPVPQLLRVFGLTLLNELLIYDRTPGGTTPLVLLGLGIQAGLLAGFIYTIRQSGKRLKKLPTIDELSQLFLWTGLVYVLVLFLVRTVSPFSGPNPRLMAPFTFCMLTAGLNWAGQWPDDLQRRLRPFWILLILASWLQFVSFSTKKVRAATGFRANRTYLWVRCIQKIG